MRAGQFRTRSGGGTRNSGIKIPVHVKLHLAHGGQDAADHQRYIDRDTACEASFGTIGATAQDRDQYWQAAHALTRTRQGHVKVGRRSDLGEALPSRLTDQAEIDSWQYVWRTRTKSEHRDLLQDVLDIADEHGLVRTAQTGIERKPPLPDAVRAHNPRQTIIQYRMVLASRP